MRFKSIPTFVILTILVTAYACGRKGSTPQSKSKSKAKVTTTTDTTLQDPAAPANAGDYADQAIIRTPQQQTMMQLALAGEPQPLEQLFPDVVDRFHLATDNSFYYDFKRPDGRWDLEVSSETFDSLAFNPDFDTAPNLLFSADFGVKQMQPIRMSDDRILIFYIRNKSLWVMPQLKPHEDLWGTPEEIDQAETAFPRLSPEGKIEIIYMKKDEQNSMFFHRFLDDEVLLEFDQPEPFPELTDISKVAFFMAQLAPALEKQGIVILSYHPGDLQATKDLSETASEEAPAAPLSLVDDESQGLQLAGAVTPTATGIATRTATGTKQNTVPKPTTKSGPAPLKFQPPTTVGVVASLPDGKNLEALPIRLVMIALVGSAPQS